MVTPILKEYFDVDKTHASNIVYIIIVNLLLVEYKKVCIMVSLDILVVDIIPSDNFSQLMLSRWTV